MECSVKNKLHISELFYYLMLFCFLSVRAVGIQDGQWPFKVALILGFVFFVPKYLTTKYNILEHILNLALIALGIVIFLNNGHLEALVGFCIVIGMKNIKIRTVMILTLAIWGSFFVFSVIRALLGFFQGYVGTATKTGMSFGVVRYSLGFTHPNVLHMTYLIIVLLILYFLKTDRKKKFSAVVLLMIGNFYIFLYSVSYTGFVVVTFALGIFLFLESRKKLTLLDKILSALFVIGCSLVLIMGSLLVDGNLKELFNKVLNERVGMTSTVFSTYSLSLIGRVEDIHALDCNLDCSYAYMIFYSGIIVFALFVVSYVMTVINSVKKNDKRSLMVLLTISLAGVTEQFVGNLSFKNLSLFFIGDYFYNDFSRGLGEKHAILSKQYSLIDADSVFMSKKWFEDIRKRVINYFSGTKWLKCILPAIIFALLCNLVFNIVWEEPVHIYRTVTDYSEGEMIPFNEAQFKQNPEKNLVIGEVKDGEYVASLDWVSTRVETYRGEISSVFWGFILGFIISAFILNTRKLNSVFIEETIEKSGSQGLPDMPKCSILGTNIAVTNMKNTVSYLEQNLELLRGKYICVSNVHTTVMSYRDKEYQDVQNNAVFALPDGKPLSYVSRRRGYFQADRVAGPDLMTEIFKISAKKGYRHFFFGSTDETLKLLKEKLEENYPGINIAGMCSPKYYANIKDIPEEENDEHVRIIKEAKPDFIWVGLGAPKQELWMAAHENCFDGIMLGVGAGFDFHAGTVKRAPKILQMLYLEWFYRLLQDPKRLFKRYFDTNLTFIRRTRVENKKLKRNEIPQDKKRLLIYAHYYAPDVASTGQILTELAEGILDDFEITVVAAVPSYSGKIDDYYKQHRFYQQNLRGVRVIRVRVPEFTKANKLSRIRNLGKYFFRACKVTKKLGGQDYILAISQPPILGGMLGRYGKATKKAKLIYNIQDFNPEQIETVSYSKNKFVISILKLLDKKSCRKSDLIITVGRDLGETIEKRFKKEKKIPNYIVINNWIDEEKIYPLDSNDTGVREFKQKYHIEDKFVFMYSGNLGLYYDLENILKVIERIPEKKTKAGEDIIYAFVGDGTLKPTLECYKESHQLDNVYFIPYQDKDKLLFSLNAADVHICVNAKGIKGVSCPSKYYGIAAVGKPVLASLEEGTEIRCLIEETKSGLISEPCDYDAFEKNIRAFMAMSPEELYEMGNRGHSKLATELRKDVSIQKYKEAILNL